ncbi:MAG: FAD:protein FMN transferase [Candidatus Pelethousia sp.]|nr:FAD:protein FMN transferase [Candidatus Pelethousia sp.]
MKIKRLTALFLCLALLFTSGCMPRVQRRYRAQFLSLFDTVTTITGYAQSEAQFTELAEKLRAKLEEYHQLYDIYHDYEGVNNIKTINDNAGAAPVKVDHRIIELLKLMIVRNRQTGGAVNVAMGAVLSIWHDYREAGLQDPENARLPPMELLRAAAEHTDIANIVIDEAASTVYLRDPQMRLDVGSTAKGYAAEQVALYAKNLGAASMLISVGGNVRTIGSKLEADSKGDTRWNIGIQNPDKTSDQTEILYVLVNDAAIVSSGIYERYYVVDGVQYSHIIDPDTLMPSTNYLQVTILCGDSGTADSLSTAVFNLPLEEGKRLLAGMDGVEAAWVLPDGSIEYTSGFSAYVKD